MGWIKESEGIARLFLKLADQIGRPEREKDGFVIVDRATLDEMSAS